MHYRIFDTAMGAMAIGWTADGVSRAMLAGQSVERMRERLDKAGGSEDARGQQELVDRIVAYAKGATDDFRDVSLDLAGIPSFNRSAYVAIREIGYGRTTTYGDVARRLGNVARSRAVGAAMAANPIPLIIPCHRVLAADGRPGGFSAPGGVESKLRMLALERATSPQGQYSLGI